jgi:(p)ppGpp synthase/HD superfamily hydrolase
MNEQLLRRQVFDETLVVFDEIGQKIRLPARATVRNVVEQFGKINRAGITVQVNGELRPLDSPLRDGDTEGEYSTRSHDQMTIVSKSE